MSANPKGFSRTAGLLMPAVAVALLAGGLTCHAARVKILYMNWFYEASQNAVEMEVIKRFNESQKSIEVVKSAVTGDAFTDKVLAMFTGGKSPDILCVLSQTAIRFYQQKLLKDIEPYIKSDKFDMTQFRDGSAYFMRPELNAAATYGMPWGVGTLNIIYNKKAFREAGNPMPYKGWTTEDFVEAARKMTKDTNGDGKPDMFGTEGFGIYYNGWPFLDGGEYIDAKRKVTVDTPAFQSSLQLLADLGLKYKVAGGNFEAGKCAITSQWDGYTNKLVAQKVDKKFDFSTTWLPKGQGKLVSFMWGHVMAIPTGSKHPREAWEFMKFYQSEEAQRILGKSFLYPMTKKGYALMEKEMRVVPGMDAAEILRPYMDTGIIKTIPWWIPGFTDTYEKYIGTFSTDVLAGRKSVQQWTDVFKREMEKVLARKK